MKEKHEGNFKKAIGPFSGISIVAGMVIGSGIYYLGSYVLERTGMSLGWSLVAWLIGGLITIISGLCFATVNLNPLTIFNKFCLFIINSPFLICFLICQVFLS